MKDILKKRFEGHMDRHAGLMWDQSLGDFDCKDQTWLSVPEEFRKAGDGLFANKHHRRTFVYYNGAESYYSVCGYRTILYLN